MQIIIKGNIPIEKKNNSNSREMREPINLVNTTIQTKEQVNTTNKVKYIIFPTTIKLKTLKSKLDVMLDTRANKNILFGTLVPQEDQQILIQPLELV